jgi:hypothetical protein
MRGMNVVPDLPVLVRLIPSEYDTGRRKGKWKEAVLF